MAKILKTSIKEVGIKILAISKNIMLFNNSIKENISMSLNADEIDSSKIEKSLYYSELNSFVKEKKEGLDFIIDEKGKNLSMGQIQRIAIARGLYTDAEGLIFDEFTSSLDQETQRKILLSLNNLIGKKQLFLFRIVKMLFQKQTR